MHRWVLALAVLASSPAAAATYTVSPTGNDSSDGVRVPFRTLQRAVQVLQDGDTVVLTSGTYAAGAWIERRNVTLRGEGEVILDGRNGTRDDGISIYETSGITLENLKIRNCRRMGVFCVLSRGIILRNCDLSYNAGSGFLTGNTSDVLVEGCTAGNNDSHGIYLSQSGDRLTVRGCKLFYNQRGGLQINAVQDSPNASDPDADSLSRDCLVEGNTLYGNGSAGGSALNLMGVQRSVLVNNLVYGNLAGGIALFDDGAGPSYACKDNRLLHNTILFGAGVGRYGVQLLAGSTGNQLAGNIITCGLGPALETRVTVQSNYNCFFAPQSVNSGSLASWQRSSGNDANSLEGNPLLSADFRLPAGSPGVDMAPVLYGSDITGALRPQGAGSDVGCFEAGGQAASFSVAGTVRLNGSGLGGVRVAAGSQSTQTDSDGQYVFSGLAAGSYSVSAFLTGYSISGGGAVSVGPSASNVDFTATATSGIAPTDGLVFEDAPAAGWKLGGWRARYSISRAVTPYSGTAAIALTVTGVDGCVTLKGGKLDTAGRSYLRFAVHGGASGGQFLRARLWVDGVQGVAVNLHAYAVPRAGEWVEYAVPLSALSASSGTITGIKFFAGSAQRQLFIDDVRVD